MEILAFILQAATPFPKSAGSSQVYGILYCLIGV